uniref:Uncharacterized protein n=1 Tax=Anguilla anguilla TaxID=7936 RepID=A0A0E9VP43_ANGAN
MVFILEIYSQNLYRVIKYQIWPGTSYRTFTEPLLRTRVLMEL